MTYLVIKGAALIGVEGRKTDAEARAAAIGAGARVMNLQAAVVLLDRLSTPKGLHRVYGGKCVDERATQATRILREAQECFK